MRKTVGLSNVGRLVELDAINVVVCRVVAQSIVQVLRVELNTLVHVHTDRGQAENVGIRAVQLIQLGLVEVDQVQSSSRVCVDFLGVVGSSRVLVVDYVREGVSNGKQIHIDLRGQTLGVNHKTVARAELAEPQK